MGSCCYSSSLISCLSFSLLLLFLDGLQPSVHLLDVSSFSLSIFTSGNKFLFQLLLLEHGLMFLIFESIHLVVQSEYQGLVSLLRVLHILNLGLHLLNYWLHPMLLLQEILSHLLRFFWFELLLLHLLLPIESHLLLLKLLSKFSLDLVPESHLKILKIALLQESILTLEIHWVWLKINLRILIILHGRIFFLLRCLLLLLIGLRNIHWTLKMAHCVIMAAWASIGLKLWGLVVDLWENCLVRVTFFRVLLEEVLLVLRERLVFRAKELWSVFMDNLGSQLVHGVGAMDAILEHSWWGIDGIIYRGLVSHLLVSVWVLVLLHLYQVEVEILLLLLI